MDLRLIVAIILVGLAGRVLKTRYRAKAKKSRVPIAAQIGRGLEVAAWTTLALLFIYFAATASGF